MKTLSPALAERLDAGATTLARCWRITRADGAVLGFTDHDRDLVFDGVTHAAATGLSGSEAVASAGFAVGAAELDGALVSDTISADDLAAGDYDGAAVEVILVDWTDPSIRLSERRGVLGEVIRANGAFRAELRGLGHALEQTKGRLYRHGCDADLGDARCGIDLTSPVLRGTGAVISASADRFLRLSGLAGFAAGWFDRGRLGFSSGANAGRAMEVKAHTLDSAVASIELWQAMPRAIAPGDTVTLTAGCDKSFSTCRERFANAESFRGFPHMPGTDFALAHPSRRTLRPDGEPLVP